MAENSIKCSDCGDDVDYWRVHCRCGQFVGFPNYRIAVSEHEELARRYEAARADAKARGIEPLLAQLEALAGQALPVIGMSFAACDDILRPGKYRNYHQRVESGERDPASMQDHADRDMVGARLCPMYEQRIVYAALSPDGRGLVHYGPVAVRWNVTPTYLGRRASLLEENSFVFYNRHSLGARGSKTPEGYRATWPDRAKLAVAKLVSHSTRATEESNPPDVLLRVGTSREDDDFIEVFIYAERGLDTRDVNMVTLQRPPITSEERRRRELIVEMCAMRDVPCRQ